MSNFFIEKVYNLQKIATHTLETDFDKTETLQVGIFI